MFILCNGTNALERVDYRMCDDVEFVVVVHQVSLSAPGSCYLIGVAQEFFTVIIIIIIMVIFKCYFSGELIALS